MTSEERISPTQKGRLVDIPVSSNLVSDKSLAVSTQKILIDGCESTTGWSAQDQATSLTTSTTHIHGTKSLSFDKSGTAGTTGYIEKTMTAMDLGVYQTHAIIHINFYVSDTTNITKIFIRIGTDSSNYFQYDCPVADMGAGWNDCDFIITRPNSQAGDGANLSSITYVAFGIELNSNSDTLSGILIDNITAKRMIEILSFAGVEIPPATRKVVITDRNSNKRADVELDGSQYALHVKSNSLATEATLNSIKDTDGIKKITDALPAGTNTIGSVGVVSLPPLPAGTNTIGSVGVTSLPSDVIAGMTSLPAGTNNIGDVDIASALPAGTNTIGSVGVVSLPPLPAGTNNIGDVDIASIAAGTATIGAVKSDGVKYTPVTKSYSWTTAQTGTPIWTPGTQTSIVLLGALISTSAAMKIELESGGADVIPPCHLAANGGAVISGGGPIWKGGSSDALTVTSSAAGSHSVMVWGYEEA